jgi:hypothetical protein
MATIMILFLAVPVISFRAEGSEKKDSTMIRSLDLAGPVPGINIFRGDFLTVTAQLKSEGGTKTGPLRVRLYLATDREGVDIKHEFDIFHDIVLEKSGSASPVKYSGFDLFHHVMLEKGGGVQVTGQYVIPYNIAAGNQYYVVVEVSPESGENKSRLSRDINIPCDALPYFDDSTSAKFPAYNFCGERD